MSVVIEITSVCFGLGLVLQFDSAEEDESEGQHRRRKAKRDTKSYRISHGLQKPVSV